MYHATLNHEQDVTVWFIGFAPYAGTRRWLKKWLHPRYGHVFALTQFGDDVLVVEPTEKAVSFGLLRHPTGEKLCADLAALAWAAQREDLHFLRVQTKAKPLGFAHGLLPTCVTFIKAISGIGGWAVTPYQLYHHLMRRGALPLPTFSI